MTRLLAVLLLVGACCATDAKGTKQNWKRYTFAEDGFIISLPAPVKPHKDSQDPNFNIYSVPLETNSLLNLRAASRFTDCDVAMRGLRQMLENSKVPDYRPPIAGSFKQFLIGGSRALQYEYQFSNNQKGFDRYYCTNQKLYIFSVVYPKDQARPASSDRVWESFQLIRDDSRHSFHQIPARTPRGRKY